MAKVVQFDHVVVHAPYCKLSKSKSGKRAFAVEFLTIVIRTASMHVKQMVLHPGSAVGLDREQAVTDCSRLTTSYRQHKGLRRKDCTRNNGG